MNDLEDGPPEQSKDQAFDHSSKSARKREALKMQALGLRLTKLKPQQLESLNLADELLKSINDYKRFASREAKRRQLQYVGKLMRVADIDAIQTELDTLDRTSSVAQYQHAQSELWRERLLTENEALSEYIEKFPTVDRQKLRQLIRKTQSTQQAEQRKTAARALFRFLYDTEK